jgi:molybdate transport system ATP-binding protein
MPQLSVDVRFRRSNGFALDVKLLTSEGVTALSGPSGSGKSTLLHLIAGVLQPSDGSIRLGQRTLVDTNTGINLPPEKRLIGMVFQELYLFPHMTVRKNMLFGKGRQGGRPMSLERVVEVLEIGELLPRFPATLSGGERQRVALGRALLRGPELLLLDEPLTALDQSLKERVLAYLRRIFQEWRIPTLVVCHQRPEVDRIADQIISIRSGQVVESAVVSAN